MRRENQNPGLGSPRLARRHQRRTNERAANESVFVFVFVFQKPKTKNQKREKKRRKSSDTGNHGAAITLINALNESQQIRWPAADKINLGAPRLNSAITATHTHTHTHTKSDRLPFFFLDSSKCRWPSFHQRKKKHETNFASFHLGHRNSIATRVDLISSVFFLFAATVVVVVVVVVDVVDVVVVVVESAERCVRTGRPSRTD